MKQHYLVFLFIIFTTSICSGHSIFFKSEQQDSLQLKAKKLKQLYILATASTDTKEIYEKRFFDEFPGTFKQLNELYGYENSKAAILYYEATEHIMGLFNNLNSINDTVYYRKTIGIALGGKWDADAVNYFQAGLKDRIEKKPELAIYILESLPEKDVKSFWYFYFDEPHPPKQIDISLQKIKSIDSKIYTIMVSSHNEALSQEE
ncbi:MAG: hypothetical protein ACHQIM_15240 [Sphingobacteriales bacterium]